MNYNQQTEFSQILKHQTHFFLQFLDAECSCKSTIFHFPDLACVKYLFLWSCPGSTVVVLKIRDRKIKGLNPATATERKKIIFLCLNCFSNGDQSPETKIKKMLSHCLTNMRNYSAKLKSGKKLFFLSRGS